MPASPRETVLCRYHYDALDRLDNSAPSTLDSLQRFYCKTRLATEIQGSVRNSIFQHDDQLLAQQRHENARIENTLLATDQQRSVLNTLSATGPQPAAYTPYGHRSPENGLLSLLGFNGERRDPLTGHYPLGNGYRQFNPVLMRFNSPDSLSPFGRGGLNAYAYCAGDPVNLSDPTGHFPFSSSLIGVSFAVSAGATIAAFFVKDETASLLLAGLGIAASGVALAGSATKYYRARKTPSVRADNVSYNPRRPSNDAIVAQASGTPIDSSTPIASETRMYTLGDVQSLGDVQRGHRNPVPVKDLPPDYSQFGPPSYAEASRANSQQHGLAQLESRLSLSQHQTSTRTRGSSLSSSRLDNHTQNIRVRKSI